jgi:hypothetical protein
VRGEGNRTQACAGQQQRHGREGQNEAPARGGTGDKLKGDGNRLARISVVTQFPDMAEEEAAAVLREAKALCTVTNTLSNAPAILYTAASGQASGQGVDFDVEGRFSRR